MPDHNQTLEKLKQEDQKIREYVGAFANETTFDAVARVVYGWMQNGQSWYSAAKKLADVYGFKWPDKTRVDFEVPLREAWDRDRARIKELEEQLEQAQQNQPATGPKDKT